MNDEIKATTDKFWMVWNEDGMAAKVKHPSADIATAEAQRLAAKFPNTRFAVMESNTVWIATINPPQGLLCVPSPAKF